mmetsp:Transcript_7032/g.6856  ORF Transcript_7032/g.6856 Transcript_7032/m.6856 type:complete len:133 (-) Transcript_7032:67-465(-)
MFFCISEQQCESITVQWLELDNNQVSPSKVKYFLRSSVTDVNSCSNEASEYQTFSLNGGRKAITTMTDVSMVSPSFNIDTEDEEGKDKEESLFAGVGVGAVAVAGVSIITMMIGMVTVGQYKNSDLRLQASS